MEAGRQWYQENQGLYGSVPDKTEEEFTQEMEEKYGASLREGLEGVQIEQVHFDGAYWIGENRLWQVEIRTPMEIHGERVEQEILIFTREGKIESLASEGALERPEVRNLVESLYPRY